MTTLLRQSTAATVVLGIFVDSVDGATPETALTISQADIRLSQNGGAYVQSNNSAGASHLEGGDYAIPLDATDTNTIGRLRVRVSESGALPVYRDFIVLSQPVYDAIFGTAALSTLDAAGVRAAMGLAAANLDTQLDALPTNAELATVIAAGDDATLAAIGTLQTSVDDVPTNAELAVALASSDDATLAAIAALNDLSVADLLDAVVSGSITLEGVLRLAASAFGGKSSGGGTTTIAYRDPADTKNVISMTVNPTTGDRSAVTLNLAD